MYLKSEHRQLTLWASLHTCNVGRVCLEHNVVLLKSMPRKQSFAGPCDARESCGCESAPYQARGWLSSPRWASWGHQRSCWGNFADVKWQVSRRTSFGISCLSTTVPVQLHRFSWSWVRVLNTTQWMLACIMRAKQCQNILHCLQCRIIFHIMTL